MLQHNYNMQIQLNFSKIVSLQKDFFLFIFFCGQSVKLAAHLNLALRRRMHTDLPLRSLNVFTAGRLVAGFNFTFNLFPESVPRV
jgi:hypothetical protein